MVKLNPEIAELLGMHVGDGTLYKTNRGLVWEMRGSLEEKEYYTNHVVPLLKKIFKKEYKAKFRSGGKQGCFGIQTSDNTLAELLISFDFPIGSKTKTVTIPRQIKTAKPDIKKAFIRGCFDTDGCLRFERKNKDKNHKYPRLEFSTSSEMLCEDIFAMLVQLGFRTHKWGKKEFKVSLAGIDNLEKFIKEVKPKNKRHLNKYRFWKNNGYRNPDAAVA